MRYFVFINIPLKTHLYYILLKPPINPLFIFSKILPFKWLLLIYESHLVASFTIALDTKLKKQKDTDNPLFRFLPLLE